MKFDKETIIVLALCFVVMLAWPSICESLGWSVPAETPVEESVQPAVPAVSAVPAAKADAVQKPQTVAAEIPAPEKLVIPADGILSNGSLDLTVSGKSGAISKITFPKYKNN